MRDRIIIQIKAVLNGIATAIQSAMQPNSTIGVARYFVLLAVGFVGYSFEFSTVSVGCETRWPCLSTHERCVM